jgi:hypothetical protein
MSDSFFTNQSHQCTLAKFEQIFRKKSTIPLTVTSSFTELLAICQQEKLSMTARQGYVEQVKVSQLLNKTQSYDICFLTLTLINGQNGDIIIVALEFELNLTLLLLIL